MDLFPARQILPAQHTAPQQALAQGPREALLPLALPALTPAQAEATVPMGHSGQGMCWDPATISGLTITTMRLDRRA